MTRHRLHILAIAGLCALLGGCASLDYYAQAVGGHLDVLRRARPIGEIAADPAADQGLKQRLAVVSRLREFASRELKLPDNGSYASYADLERPYVVWNVFATPELSVRPREWCFVAAGCVGYRGFFSKDEADRFAEELRRKGDDVYVAGVPAYSTLGWFDDPVLNTFIAYPETELARLIFHELAHQVAYVADDSVFNESFATAVELEGVSRWLDRNGTAAQRAAFEAEQHGTAAFAALAQNCRERLEEAFASGDSDAAKRAAKARLFAELQQEFARLRAGGGFSRYDRWFAQQVNNAHLASVATYTRLVPAFRALLAQQQGEMGRFYEAVRELARRPEPERAARLRGEPDIPG